MIKILNTLKLFNISMNFESLINLAILLLFVCLPTAICYMVYMISLIEELIGIVTSPDGYQSAAIIRRDIYNLQYYLLECPTNDDLMRRLGSHYSIQKIEKEIVIQSIEGEMKFYPIKRKKLGF